MFFSPSSAASALKNSYNTIAEDFSNTRHFAWKEFEPLFENLPENAKVLDVGCGNGRLFAYLLEQKQIEKYTGIDISENLLDIAKKTYQETPNASFCKKSVLEIDEENAYDAIAMIASFHHLSSIAERKTALENCHRALTENGELVITVWNWRNQEKYANIVKEAQIRTSWNPLWTTHDGMIPFGAQKIPRYYYGFDPEELRDLLEQTGFMDPLLFFSDDAKNICVKAKKTIPVKKRFWITGIPFDKTSFNEVMNMLENWAQKEGLQKKVYTPNPEMVVEVQTNEYFRTILQNADLSLADGNGILWASGLKNIPLKGIVWKWGQIGWSLMHYFFARKSYPKMLSHPICGSDIFREFLEKKVGRVFLLGGTEGSAVFLQQKYDHVVGYEDGFVNEKTLPNILKKINDSHANVLFVALGAPKQEKIIHETIAQLPKISFAMGVGGSFDFLSGHQTRAPKWLRTFGLEWVYRLFKQPERARRIWNATGKFIGVMGKGK